MVEIASRLNVEAEFQDMTKQMPDTEIIGRAIATADLGHTVTNMEFAITSLMDDVVTEASSVEVRYPEIALEMIEVPHPTTIESGDEEEPDATRFLVASAVTYDNQTGQPNDIEEIWGDD